MFRGGLLRRPFVVCGVFCWITKDVRKKEEANHMKEIVYGYVRVSTREQNEERQMIALKNFPVAEEKIFLDKQSGKNRGASIASV